MPEAVPPRDPTSTARREALLDAFEAAWGAAAAARSADASGATAWPAIEDFLARSPADERSDLLAELLAIELEHRRRLGLPIDPDDYRRRFPDAHAVIEAACAAQAAGSLAHRASAEGTATHRPHAEDDRSDKDAEDADLAALLESLARFQVRRELGRGAFGVVYLAGDNKLPREVAIKVPLLQRKGDASESASESASASAAARNAAALADLLAEARKAAALQHPGLVPVYDVLEERDRRGQDRLLVVQQYVDGGNLAEYVRRERPPLTATVGLLIQVGEALAYLHERQIFHRDLKPSNVLVDRAGRAYVADLGLAVHANELLLLEGKLSGSPAYMSPEQWRGETHLIDGRSDLWSLGVMLYELLAGERPFQGRTTDALRQAVLRREPTPFAQLRPGLPEALWRVCERLLQKQASHRYPDASQAVADLRRWLAAHEGAAAHGANPSPSGGGAAPQADAAPAAEPAPDEAARVVPPGLRSYDADDADAFLALLPGVRNADGLPESVGFWNDHFHRRGADATFRVGALYGPSGCGKSSLMKAGVLPRVDPHRTLAIYLEATPDQTEARLARELHKQCSVADDPAALAATIAALRQAGGWQGRKVVLVFDQFEQWLHGRPLAADVPLVAALRQCDGAHVQAVVMVRDDFWMPTTALFNALDVKLRQDANSVGIDLFDLPHARKVLTLLGRAYQRLPAWPAALSEPQQAFVEAAVAQLADAEGRVACVRLALLADMLHDRDWVPRELEAAGGAHGVGERFLEARLGDARSVKLEHRPYVKTMRAVLQALLPPLGTDLKGQMQAAAALQRASGAAPEQLDEALHILQRDLRLIAPADPAGAAAEREDSSAGLAGQRTVADHASPNLAELSSERHYQLTHDYLVPSLRAWIRRTQRPAERTLEDRTALWTAQEEDKQLPSLREWAAIELRTARTAWTAPQRRMLRRSRAVHLRNLALGAAATAILAAVGLFARGQVHARQERTRVAGLVAELASAEPTQLAGVLAQLDAVPALADPLLTPLLTSAATDPAAQRALLRARLAAAARDPQQAEPLLEELLANDLAYVEPIRARLRPRAAELTRRLSAELRNATAAPTRRFRAALALADYAPASGGDAPRAVFWTPANLEFVARQLVGANPETQPQLRALLSPLAAALLPPLEAAFGDASATAAERLGAASALADYAEDDAPRLARLLAAATAEQYAVLYPAFERGANSAALAELARLAAAAPDEALGSRERVDWGRRRAGAAATLMRLDRVEAALPAFLYDDDPEAITQFVFGCRARGVSLDVLLSCLDRVAAEPKKYPPETRYALLLALGEFPLEDVPTDRRAALLDQLATWFENDPSAAVHGATGWLLRQWGAGDRAAAIEAVERPYSPDREWFTLTANLPQRAESLLGGPLDRERTQPFSYTFIAFASGEYKIGSPNDQPERNIDEAQRTVTIPRTFAVLDRELTFAELSAYDALYRRYMEQVGAEPSAAAGAVTWYDAVRFCRWLGERRGLLESAQAYADPESLDATLYAPEPDPRANGAPRNWPLRLEQPGFRLPTEAEWEAACRGGARTAYGFGGDSQWLARFGWYQDNSQKRLHAPRALRPSVRGMFDVHGNVWEWTHDWYAETGEDSIDRGERSEGLNRVLRGGSWPNGAAFCRTAYRHRDVPTDRSGDNGFRLALSPLGASSTASAPSEEVSGAGGRRPGGSTAEPRPEAPEPAGAADRK